jgi:hypothetical protein
MNSRWTFSSHDYFLLSAECVYYLCLYLKENFDMYEVDYLRLLKIMVAF